jgi:RNA polymerase sigma-70 factor (ECF subfamily)
MSVKSDLELVKDFQAGKVEAFNELVRRYQQKVYWIARRMVGDHDEADDVTQEVFVKVYKKIKNFRSDSSFYTWVYRITTNTAINVLRQRKIVNLVRLDEVFPALSSMSDDSLDPAKKLEMKENQSLLEEAVSELPAKQKKVFVLRYFEEMPYEDISKILKITVGGLKANYFHALKNIQKYVKGKIDL